MHASLRIREAKFQVKSFFFDISRSEGLQRLKIAAIESTQKKYFFFEKLCPDKTNHEKSQKIWRAHVETEHRMTDIVSVQH